VKTSLWSIVVLVSGVVGFLMGYSMSSSGGRGATVAAGQARGPEISQLQEEVARLRLGLGQVEADVDKLKEALGGGRAAEKRAEPPRPGAVPTPERPPAPKAAALRPEAPAPPRPAAPAPTQAAPKTSPAKAAAAGY